MSKTIILQPL